MQTNVGHLMIHPSVLQESGGQESLHLAHRVWLYMPFMHSEEIQDQEVVLNPLRLHRSAVSPATQLICCGAALTAGAHMG